MDAAATAIELEASYQIWRAQHERYLLLSRRVWQNDAAPSEVRKCAPQSGHAEGYGDRDHAAGSLSKVKVEIVVADEVATHAVETISRAAPDGTAR